ncbi:MAG: sterol desaturase family protein [Anaerolineae bacterium]|nr:sterol desaturase family protein [Anaerolineae bacterium]
MNVLINALVVIAVAVWMEGMAWATHKYVMHGFLWVLHEDHHRPTHRGLQKNDLFALFFSVISCLLIVNGLLFRIWPLFSAGLGMLLYGIGYVLFHDVMFHRRIPGLRIKPRGRYLQRIVRAHKLHHQNSNQKGSGVAFGFLYARK